MIIRWNESVENSYNNGSTKNRPNHAKDSICVDDVGLNFKFINRILLKFFMCVLWIYMNADEYIWKWETVY